MFILLRFICLFIWFIYQNEKFFLLIVDAAHNFSVNTTYFCAFQNVFAKLNGFHKIGQRLAMFHQSYTNEYRRELSLESDLKRLVVYSPPSG